MAPGVGSCGSGFLLAGLVNGRALSDAVVVTLPDDVGVDRESEQTLDRFSASLLGYEAPEPIIRQCHT